MKRNSMKRFPGKIAAGVMSLLAFLCLVLTSVIPSSAADSRNYTYTVTFSAGNQGSLGIQDGVSVSVDGGGDYKISISEDKKTVTITGLTAANSVRFLNSAVSLDSNSKYYVRGVRMGGRDNNTVAYSYFPVERDQDYVVAYGIKGNLVQYTVNYVDQDGNEVYPSQIYYGNVGDKPVLAYLYLDGYQPQAYNLTGTLQSDASRNVFTFRYRPVVTAAPSGSGSGNAGGGNTAPGGNTASGETGLPGGNTPGGTGDNAPGGNTPAGDDTNLPDDQNTPDGQNTPDDQNNSDNQNTPDDQNTPNEDQSQENNEPQQIIDIDDQNLPMSNFEGDGTIAAANRAKLRSTWIAAGIGIVAVIALAAGAYTYRRMRKVKSDSKGKK